MMAANPPQMEWQGRYLDGRTALAQPVRITIGTRGLQIVKPDRSTLWWDYGEVRQTQGAYAGEQVRLERGAPFPEALLVDDTGFLGAIHATAPERTAFHNPARRSLRLKLTLLAALCLPLLAPPSTCGESRPWPRPWPAGFRLPGRSSWAGRP